MADLCMKYVCRSDLVLLERHIPLVLLFITFHFLVAYGNVVPLGTTGKCHNIQNFSGNTT